MTFPDPTANQPQKRVQMLEDLHAWAKFIPVWAWWTMARLRPIIMRGGFMNEEDEKKLWSVWKSTHHYKSKGLIPPSEDKPFKSKPRKDIYV